MMKNRHFMLGLGIGLIVGALLLQLMLIGQGSGSQLYTKEQIQQAAEQAGLKIVESDQELLTEEEWRERSGQVAGSPDEGASNASGTPISPQEPNTPDVPEAPSQPESGDGKPISDATQGQSVAPSQSAVVEYKIVGGTTLDGVAEGLQQAGVIEDKETFVKAAIAKKINYKVRAGTYVFHVGEDFDSIINKISLKTSGK